MCCLATPPYSLWCPTVDPSCISELIPRICTSAIRLDVPNVGIVDHNLWMGNAQIAQTTSHQPIFLVYFLKQTGKGDKNKKQPWLLQDHLATQTQYLNGETRNQNGGRPAGLYYLGGLSKNGCHLHHSLLPSLIKTTHTAD